MVYIPKDFVPHAASLRHTFVHCGRFVTAAPRRSPNSVSVSMWPADLSVRLCVKALVSHYLTNQLIQYSPIPNQLPFEGSAMRHSHVIRYYPVFRLAIPESGVG